MDIKKYVEIFSKIADVNKIDDKQYEIVAGAKLNSKTPIKIYLCQGDKGCYLTDNKNCLKFMNQLYELSSADVRDCIASVIKIYKFTIVSGCLLAQLLSEKDAKETLYNYIICYGQLVNMYAFFDKPE